MLFNSLMKRNGISREDKYEIDDQLQMMNAPSDMWEREESI